MRRWGLIGVGLGLGLVSGAVLAWVFQPMFRLADHHGIPAQYGRMARTQVATEAPDFVLTDQDGRRIALRDLRGKALLVAFVYTSCPDICPIMFNVVTEVQQRVQAEGRGDVVSVFVTTDPEVDSPEVLKTFAMRRGVDFSATALLTGNPDELRVVWSAFGVKVTRLGRGLVEHSPLTVLIDTQGVIRYRYLGGVLQAEIVATDIRNVLNNRATK